MRSLNPISRCVGTARHQLALLLFLLISALGNTGAIAQSSAQHLFENGSFNDNRLSEKFNATHFRGTWVLSGMLRISLPVPFPGTLLDGAPPHDAISPADITALWAAILGTITLDGRGNVVKMENVIKIGELMPASPPVPFDFLPPLPEVYTGFYSVGEGGTVKINLAGRSADSPEGQLDFEFDLHCVVQHRALKMQCVPARFTTYVVDSSGFPAPITGLITLERQR